MSKVVMWIVLGTTFAALLLLIYFLRRSGGGKFPWLQFYTKGREAGFSFSEINLLRKVAVENQLENPTSLFWSIRQLNRSIRGILIKFQSTKAWANKNKVNFLSKLFEFRRLVELKLPKYSLGLTSSRSIANYQSITIICGDLGPYEAKVVENLRRYMAITYPEGPALPTDFSWDKQKLTVLFRRTEDAEYIFESKVQKVIDKKDHPFLHIGHSDTLTRKQKRKSIRKQLNIPATLFLLKRLSKASDGEESTPGLRCQMRDVSSDGAAVLIGGKGTLKASIKLQFYLGSSLIRMSGIVRGLSFNQKNNQSILNIEAVALPLRTRNSILCFVYNIFESSESLQKKKKLAPNQ